MFERIVRPFVAPVVISKQRIAVVPIKAPDDDPVISFGAAGDLPDSFQTNIGFTIKNLESYKEVHRKTKTVRIKNPDDNTQHVDVKRIETMTFAKKSASPGGKSTSTGYNSNTPGTGGQFDNGSGSVVSGGLAVANASFAFANGPLAANEELLTTGSSGGLPLDPGNTTGGSVPIDPRNSSGHMVPIDDSNTVPLPATYPGDLVF